MANAGTRIQKIILAADPLSCYKAVVAQRADALDIVIQQGALNRTAGVTPTGLNVYNVQYLSVTEATPTAPVQRNVNLDPDAGIGGGYPDVFA